MINAIQNEVVPLTGVEHDFLLFIYKKRKRFLLTVYSGFVVVTLFLAPFGTDHRRWEAEKDAGYLYKFGMLMRNIVFTEVMLICSGIVFYYKKVLPYKRDADSGTKEKITYKIAKKEYFPLTNQYYVAFDNPGYAHHETNKDTWDNCYEGGLFSIYRAAKSKFVFEDNGRYTVM